MVQKPFEQIVDKIRGLDFGDEEFDLVVGITRGGIVPAYLIARSLGLPLKFVEIRFRDEQHQPDRGEPELVGPVSFLIEDKRILVVDDRANSGATLKKAKQVLGAARVVKTLAVNGKADYSLFDEECFAMPWNL